MLGDFLAFQNKPFFALFFIFSLSQLTCADSDGGFITLYDGMFIAATEWGENWIVALFIVVNSGMLNLLLIAMVTFAWCWLYCWLKV